MDEARLTVGELARRTGLTVRTLHHWDELGLLTPAERSGAGYRRYLGQLVERQLAELEVRVELERRLERRLLLVREALSAGAASADDLLATIEVMTMIEKYYSEEQLAELAQRREALGPEGRSGCSATGLSSTPTSSASNVPEATRRIRARLPST